MTEDTRILQPVRFPRHERHGLFMGLQWYQLSLVALGMLIAALSSAAGGPLAFILTTPVWVGLMLFGTLQYARIPYPVWAFTASRLFTWRERTQERRGRIFGGVAGAQRPGCVEGPPSDDGLPEGTTLFGKCSYGSMEFVGCLC